MKAIVKRLIRRIGKLRDKAIYSGTSPFQDLVKLGLVAGDQFLIAIYVTPEGKIECASDVSNPWHLYEILMPIFFDVQLVESNQIKRFRGGPYDTVVKRVVHQFV